MVNGSEVVGGGEDGVRILVNLKVDQGIVIKRIFTIISTDLFLITLGLEATSACRSRTGPNASKADRSNHPTNTSLPSPHLPSSPSLHSPPPPSLSPPVHLSILAYAPISTDSLWRFAFSGVHPLDKRVVRVLGGR